MQIPRPGDAKFEILKAVNRSLVTTGKAPTYAELQEHVGLATRSGVQFHVEDLVDMGLLARLPGKTRGLRSTQKGKHLVALLDEPEMAHGSAEG